MFWPDPELPTFNFLPICVNFINSILLYPLKVRQWWKYMYKVEKIIHIFGLRKKVESKNSLLPRNEVVNFPHYKNFLYPVQRDKTMWGFYDLVFPFRTLFSPVFNVASAFLFDINVVTRNFLWGRGEGGLAPARLSKEVTRNDKLTQKAEAHTKSSVKSSNTLTYHQARFF